MSLTVIKPITITDAMLQSCSIAEDEYGAWDHLATYADGDRVIYQHRIYESTAGSNLNHNPLTDTSDPPFWVDIGPTNRWAALDNETSTVSSAVHDITWVFRPGRFAALAIIGMQASSIYVRIESDVDGVLYEQTHAIKDDSPIPDWYHYYYDDIRVPSELVIDNLPALGDVTVTVTVTNSYGDAEVGVIVFGWPYTIGKVQYGVSASIYDYSKKETDDFGVTTFVRRAYSKRANLPLILTAAEVDYVQTVLAELRAVPCLWRGGTYGALTIYGFYRDFSIDIRYPTVSACTLTLEGLI